MKAKVRVRTLVTVFMLIGVNAGEDNDFPTYDHPSSAGHKCYRCPPGFYKSKDCTISKGGGPAWPTCLHCPGSQFSQTWNVDETCSTREVCEKNHTEIFNGGDTGPTKCACIGSTLQDSNGFCVLGITSAEYEAKIKELEDRLAAESSENKTHTALLIVIGLLSSLILISFVLALTLYVCKKWKKTEARNMENAVEMQEIKLTPTAGASMTEDCKRLIPKRFSRTSLGSAGTRTSVTLNAVVTGYERWSTSFSIDQAPQVTNTTRRSLVQPDVREEDEERVLRCESPGSTEEPDFLDDALRIIERYTTGIEEADTMLRHVYSLPAIQCQSIKNQNKQEPIGTLRSGFKQWREKNGKKATVENLLTSIRKFGKNSIADEIVAELKIKEQQKFHEDEEYLFDHVVKLCEKLLSADDRTKEFFRVNLGLGETVVRDSWLDRSTCVRKGIMGWREQKGKGCATCDKLIQHFCDAGMKDIAEDIRRQMYQGQEVTINSPMKKPESTHENGFRE